MSFAQPIRRPAGSAGHSPSWLTSGVGVWGSPGAGPSAPTSGSSSAGGRRHEQELINAYEAEEERIINVLSRKLEQLREDKIELENALEAESESHVNRLARELGALRTANRTLEAQLEEARSGANGTGRSIPAGASNLVLTRQDPSAALMLEALQRENETLRARLVGAERDYGRVARLNEVYREELIAHRTRLGLSVDSLIGLTSSDRDPFAQPTHHRSRSSSASSSPAVSLGTAFLGSYAHTAYSATTSTQQRHHTHANGVPIPRPQTQTHRPPSMPTPRSISPSSVVSGSSYPLSPIYSLSGASSSDSNLNHAHHAEPVSTPASGLSVSTPGTSPPSSAPALPALPGAARTLSYPSVPPPSLASSFGSPTVALHIHMHGASRDASRSPVESRSRRGSTAGGVSGQARRMPLGGRVAETGSLVGRARAGSVSGGVLPETVLEDDTDEIELDVHSENEEEELSQGGTSVPAMLVRTLRHAGGA